MQTLLDITKNISQITEVFVAILTFLAVFLSLRTLKEMQKARIESDTSKLFIVPAKQILIVTVVREEERLQLKQEFSDHDLSLINVGSGHAIDVRLEWDWSSDDSTETHPPRYDDTSELGWIRVGHAGSLIYIEDCQTGTRKTALGNTVGKATFVGIKSKMDGSQKILLPDNLILQMLLKYTDDSIDEKAINTLVTISYSDTYRRNVVESYTLRIETLRSEVSPEQINLVFDLSVHKGQN